MRTVNQEHVEAALELINQGPYFQLLNMDIKELGIGYCLIEVKIERKHLNPFGVVHGGVYASILDTAAYWACYCEMEEDQGFITLDLDSDNLRATTDGILTVVGRTVKTGRNICLCEAEVRDEQDRLIASCKSKQFIGKELQPIRAAVESLSSKPLPPNFLD